MNKANESNIFCRKFHENVLLMRKFLRAPTPKYLVRIFQKNSRANQAEIYWSGIHL